MPDTIKPRTTLKIPLTMLGLVSGLAIGKIAFSPKAPEKSNIRITLWAKDRT